MALLALRDVEKIERFYLSSCTELTPMIAKSMHRSFPALNINANVKSQTNLNPSRLSRTKSRKEVNFARPESESDSTLTNNNRAKRAFLRMCDTLGSAEKGEPQLSCSQQDEPPQLTNEPLVEETNLQLITTPSMTKAEFLKKMEEGMFREKPVDKENIANVPMDHQYAKSEYVLSKSTKDPDNVMTSGQNQTKSESAIADDKSSTDAGGEPNNNGHVAPEGSATSKVIFTGFLLFFILGLVKSAHQNN